MTPYRNVPIAALVLLLAAGAASAQAPGASPVPGLTYHFEKVTDGVYCAIASGVPYYVSNAIVIVGDGGAAVVDPGAGPAEARILRAAVRTVTDRPVR